MFKAMLKVPSTNTEEVEMPKPRISLDSKTSPEIKDWELGKEYTLKFKMCCREEHENGDMSVELELVTGSSDKGKDSTDNEDSGDDTKGEDTEAEM